MIRNNLSNPTGRRFPDNIDPAFNTGKDYLFDATNMLLARNHISKDWSPEDLKVKKVISFSGRSGAGKSTIAGGLAKRLESEGYVVAVRSMATGLKRVAYKMMEFLGSEIHLAMDSELPRHKDPFDIDVAAQDPSDKVFTRELLQFYGTDFGRNSINPSIWIGLENAYLEDLLIHNADHLPDKERILIYDDIRFENELQWIKDWPNHQVFFIEREGVPVDPPNAHSTERLKQDHFDKDENLYNLGIEDKLDMFIETLFYRVIEREQG